MKHVEEINSGFLNKRLV